MTKRTLFSLVLCMTISIFPTSTNAQNTNPPMGDCENLFISEITFGKSQNGNFFDLNYAIEIYNPTDMPINLAAYKLELTDLMLNVYSFPMDGIINAGEVHVVCNSNADLNLQGMADELSAGMDFELYACLELMQGNIVLDKIGQKFSNNPNNSFDPVLFVQDPFNYMLNYDLNLNEIENISLRRGYFEKKGDPVFSPAADALIGHWSFHQNTNRSNIGIHANECQPEAEFMIGFKPVAPAVFRVDLLNTGLNNYLFIYHPSIPPNYPFSFNTTYSNDPFVSTASIGVFSAEGVNCVAVFGSDYGSDTSTTCTMTKFNAGGLQSSCEHIQYYRSINVTPPSEFVKIDLSSNTPGVTVDSASNKFFVYFEKWPTAINKYDKLDVKVYPTLFYDNISVALLEEGEYSIYDFNGAIVKKGKLLKGENLIALTHLSIGTYILRINNKKHVQAIKIQKL